MPVLPRWRHEVGEPVQEFKRREFDGGSGVEEAPPLEPADHAAARPLGDRGQMDLSDRPHRQERRRIAAACH
jgi:hypothetical protein